MKAISIRQPWAHAILHFGKRIENREWDPSGGNVAHARRLIGETIAIHAGKGCTRDEYEDASYAIDLAVFRQDVTPPLRSLPRGAIVGTARLVDILRTTDNAHRIPLRAVGVPNCILCGLGCPPDACSRADPWAIPGSLGLVLAEVVALPTPVPWSGALGFFEVPDSAFGGGT